MSVRSIVIANIAALAAAVLSLIWNTAVVYTKFNRVQEEQDRMRAVESAIVEVQNKQGEAIAREQESRQLLDGRIFRLEDLGLQKKP